MVGDIIHLSCNEIIPADMVLLRSSDDAQLCFIDTANLDGENNLKQRQCVKGLQQVIIHIMFIIFLPSSSFSLLLSIFKVIESSAMTLSSIK